MAGAKKPSSLYESVIDVSTDYLGPTAKRFIDRQIENHINKHPTELQAKDLEQLIDWIRIAVSLLTEDVTVVQEYTDRLLSLTKTNKEVYRNSGHS